METPPETRLDLWLAAPARCESVQHLAESWRDVECHLTLAPVAPADSAFGAHLRGSFLAALGPGASDQARQRRPCPWEPPCALDIFLREHLRKGGDGLPKPYVLFWQQEGPAMQVTLRLFGAACDWGPAAFEAMVAALRALPWQKALSCDPPRLLHREVVTAPWIDLPDAPLTLTLLSPMDDEGTADKGRDLAARLLSRALRRVDALARWQGLALQDDAVSALTAQAHAVTARDLRVTPGRHFSPNVRGETRISKVLSGQIDLPPLSDDLRLVLALALRVHLGRHTNEGLGRCAAQPTARNAG